MKDQGTTLIEQRKKHALAIQAQIIELLGWSEMHYCEFKYEQGLEYLYEYVKSDAYKLEGNRIFWNWWKNQWTNRDMELLRTDFVFTIPNPTQHQLEYIQARRMTMYLTTHDGCYLASAMSPHFAMMEQSYAEMTRMVVKIEAKSRLDGYEGIPQIAS